MYILLGSFGLGTDFWPVFNYSKTPLPTFLKKAGRDSGTLLFIEKYHNVKSFSN